MVDFHRLFGGLRDGACAVHHFIQPTFKFVAPEILDERVFIAVAKRQLLRGKSQFYVGFDGRQRVGQIRHVFFSKQFFTEFLRPTNWQFGDFIQIGINLCHTADAL